MLKKLALSVSVLALTTGLAFAEMSKGTSTTTGPATSGRSVAGSSASSLATNKWLASDVYKSAVYDSSENKIGDVADLVIDRDGKVTAAIISVGGFLGVGEKDVSVPFDELQMSKRNGKDRLMVNRTKQELKEAPAWNKSDWSNANM